MKKKFYITTPIYYPNAKPHIGSIYSTVLADIFARYAKLSKQNVVFLTGLDEHGQKVYQAAEKVNKAPQEFVNDLANIFKAVFKQWNIDYTIFMRTTNDFHKKAVKEWIVNLQNKGFIYKAEYKGWYSIGSEAFLLEKDCELKNKEGIPICPITQKPAIWVTQEAYFFKLSSFENHLLDFFQKNPHFITPKERLEEVVSFIKSGLKDLCISRLAKDLSWGIPFPGDEKHVVYVWADALNNYITAIGYLQNNSEFNSIWPCDVHVMAKDIIRFHAVYWIAFLLAADLPLPKKELVHGWLLVNNQKMSKSLDNVIDPIKILEKYEVDSLRYYFSTLSIREDSDFNIVDLEQRHNSDLCDNLSNLFQRMFVLSTKKNIFTIELDFDILPNEYKEIVFSGNKIVQEVQKEIENYNILKITQLIMGYLNQLNAFFHHQQPWKETNIENFKLIIAVICGGLFQTAVLLLPIMPTKMKVLLDSLGVLEKDRFFDSIVIFANRVFTLKNSEDYIFKKYISLIEKKEDVVMTKTKKEEPIFPHISFDEFNKSVVLVGKIIVVEDIPKSDKLYYLTVDFGQFGKKKIASGIKQHYQKDQLLEVNTIFSFNLAPRSLCGVVSEGMILMVKNKEGIPELIRISDNVLCGTRLG
jgi:methionyl-tRNA synthetase